MRLRHMTAGLCLMLVFAVAARAGVIVSTTAGGPWHGGATWVGGIAPGPTDDVEIVGPVAVDGTGSCRDMIVATAGHIVGASGGPSHTLQVGGSLTNAGIIDDGTFFLDLEVGGGLYNLGQMLNRRTSFTGAGPRHIEHTVTAAFDTDIHFAPGASGDLVAPKSIALTGDVDVTGGRLVLQPGAVFTLDRGFFSGELAANGNEMRFVSWSYLQQCTLDDVVLVGEVEAAHGVSFTTRVAVTDTLRNSSSTGSVVIEGDLVNNGLITNNNYGFVVNVEGGVENNGRIDNSQLVFQGTAEHHLSMGPNAEIHAQVFLPEFQARTLVADTSVRFADGLNLGIGTLVLAPGSSLEFTHFGEMWSGEIQANDNTISVAGSGHIGDVTIDRGVIADQVAMTGTNHCTGGLTVVGTLKNWDYEGASITVEGTLRNEGKIVDDVHEIRITALGDVVNLGEFTNTRLVLDGDQDQSVGTGAGIAVPVFVIESNIPAASHQWYRNGAPLPGETGPDLTLAFVGPAHHGDYHCQGGGAEMSRTISITESVATGVPSAAVVRLGNHPNPFNPRTEIFFDLQRDAQVSLVIYDLAGRRVDRLVDGPLTAGLRRVVWQPRRLPSGTYVYRLRADGEDAVGRCTLIK